jgi:hypothetical protein
VPASPVLFQLRAGIGAYDTSRGTALQHRHHIMVAFENSRLFDQIRRNLASSAALNAAQTYGEVLDAIRVHSSCALTPVC